MSTPAIDSHVAFVSSVIGAPVTESTEKLLNKKYKNFTKEVDETTDYTYFPRQLGYVLTLPITLAKIALQIIGDIGVFIVVGMGELCTLGYEKTIDYTFKEKTFNLFVADPLIALSIIPSIFYKGAYLGAESLHLGTFRSPWDAEALPVKAVTHGKMQLTI